MNNYGNYDPHIAPCSICGQMTEKDYDSETGSWYTTRCRLCARAVSETPYCHRGDCPRQICGTHTQIVNGHEIGRGAKAIYECPRCNFSGTAIHWAVQASYGHATYDAERALRGEMDLTKVRAKTARQNVQFDYPIRRAQGRAYLLGLRHAGIEEVVSGG